jgi:1-deoxy-D-xylulose-5-phosphate synthase
LLRTIDGPADLRGLSAQQLETLCGEVRDYIVETVTRTGGHLAPSLGVVELTVALHRVFESPRDKIVWDVGHQCYAHKILTGRREAFRRLRQSSGPSGFCRRSESEHDPFGAGHASTSISGALGLAAARDARGEGHHVVAVIGDGGLSGGLAFEGLDNAGGCNRDFIVILNDNNMSISPTVGALSRHLTGIITHPIFERIKKEAWEFTEKLPRGSETVRRAVRRIEESLKGLLTPGIYFESLGFRYLGPIDGHDLSELIGVLEKVKRMRGPILVHVLTRKGRGLPDAEDDPCRFHGVAPRVAHDGKTAAAVPGLAYTQVFGETLTELAETRPEVAAITAAMCDGTGLTGFAQRYPQRFHDVGIAEGHALTFAAGMAAEGLRPVVAIYSTFLQRAFDQLIHDVALQGLPVVVALDRAGLVGEDGATHHGAFDLSYLGCIPEMVVAAPSSGRELRDLLLTALEHRGGPFAIRYPRSAVPDADALAHAPTPLVVGEWQVIAPGRDAVMLAVGAMVETARGARQLLAARGLDVGLVNARFVKPLDGALLRRLSAVTPLLVTVEEGALAGGFGARVRQCLAEDEGVPRDRRVVSLGLPDAFVAHGTRGELLEQVGLTAAGIAERVAAAVAAGGKAPVAAWGRPPGASRGAAPSRAED